MGSKNILVTGGAGYIGSHAVLNLKEHGYSPIIFDNFVGGSRKTASELGVQTIEGSTADVELQKKIITEHKISAVMHFAAFLNVGESVSDPGKYYENNLIGTLNLLKAMITCGCKTIIFSSTCATYGIPAEVPINENSNQNPINSYGRSKLMVEWMLRDFERAHNLKWVALRYFNAAGADIESRIGERHDPENHLVPLAIHAALKASKLSIFGNDYPTPDGTCIRDYIHVTDIAEAHRLALEHLNKDGKSDAFNIGTGDGYSVLELIKMVEKLSGKSVGHVFTSRRPGDPPKLVAEASKIKGVLNWEPKHSSLQEIVKTALAWHKKDWNI